MAGERRQHGAAATGVTWSRLSGYSGEKPNSGARGSRKVSLRGDSRYRGSNSRGRRTWASVLWVAVVLIHRTRPSRSTRTKVCPAPPTLETLPHRDVSEKVTNPQVIPARYEVGAPRGCDRDPADCPKVARYQRTDPAGNLPFIRTGSTHGKSFVCSSWSQNIMAVISSPRQEPRFRPAAELAERATRQRT
jgi:hypothetical protein